MSATPSTSVAGEFPAVQPGSPAMPKWDRGELIDAPRFTWRSWALLLGPGLVTGGAAIGGGEWLTGPLVTAKYGGALLWLATLSILGQVVYNLEISRYTLYTGEPIFTGKFRTLPHPVFWLGVYLLLDLGSIFPYLAGAAATPLAALLLGHIPNPKLVDPTVHILGMSMTEQTLLRVLAIVVFLLTVIPLVFGGKVYNALKAVMSFKIVAVLGFLTFLAVMFSQSSTWVEIGSGFFRFGTVPIHLPEGQTIQTASNVDNVFVSLWEGRGFPVMDLSMIGVLAAMASISGSGGLTNTSVSGFTRDQGWGMGHHVGAIPSVVGGQRLSLSHVGMIFPVNSQSLLRWRRWLRHVARDQLVVWMPACFVGLALPSMLSVQFLPRGTSADKWTAAGMTADGVANAVGGAWGPTFWYLTILCGLLILATSMASTADGVLRRWVDVVWTSLPSVRRWESHRIRGLYFSVLCGYVVLVVSIMILVPNAGDLLIWATNIYNYALGFSCWHTLAINVTLLPKPLRPNWGVRICLVFTGIFFFGLGLITTAESLGMLTHAAR